MIIVSLDQTWPKVLEGIMTAERATLDTWPVRSTSYELDQFRRDPRRLPLYVCERVRHYDVARGDGGGAGAGHTRRRYARLSTRYLRGPPVADLGVPDRLLLRAAV